MWLVQGLSEDARDWLRLATPHTDMHELLRVIPSAVFDRLFQDIVTHKVVGLYLSRSNLTSNDLQQEMGTLLWIASSQRERETQHNPVAASAGTDPGA